LPGEGFVGCLREGFVLWVVWERVLWVVWERVLWVVRESGLCCLGVVELCFRVCGFLRRVVFVVVEEGLWGSGMQRDEVGV
jgi:hypothetical protein